MADFAKCFIVVAFFFQILEPGLSNQQTCPRSLFEMFHRGVSKKDEIQIVREINRYRRQLSNGRVDGQPRAIKLPRISYSRDLAYIAQECADTCQVDYDPRFIAGIRLGQVVLKRYVRKKLPFGGHWKQTIQRWLALRNYFKYPNNTESGASYYAQLVNQRATQIGCGYSNFLDRRDKKKQFQKLYICYFDSMVRYGQAPYDTPDDTWDCTSDDTWDCTADYTSDY